MKKPWLVLGTVPLICVVGAAILVATIDSESIGRAAIAAIDGMEGVTFEAEEIELGLFSGLELGSAGGTLTLESGVLQMSVRRLRLVPRLLPLLGRRVVVRTAVLEEPRLELLSGKVTPTLEDRRARRRMEQRRRDGDAAGSASAGTVGLALEVAGLQISDGSVVVRAAGAETPEFKIDGFDLELENLNLARGIDARTLRGDGVFSAEILRVGDVEARDAQGLLAIADGRLSMRAVAVSTETADLEMHALDADFNLDPWSYELTLDGDIDLNEFVAASGNDLGPAMLQLEASGTGAEADRVKGRGRVRLEAGEIPTPSVIAELEALLGRSILSGVDYEATDIDFELRNNSIFVEPFDLASGEVTLGVDGRIGLDGRVDLRMRVRAPREKIELDGAGRDVLDALTSDAGLVTVPFTVRGTMEEPVVRPAWDEVGRSALDAAVDAAKEALEKRGLSGAGELLDRLLDRSSEDDEATGEND